MGFDVHRLVEGRELWLGGVNIPWERGLLGHSDADVAIHALCDALLGAAALRDIGYHFPDTDPRYKGIDSRLLLRHVMKLLDEQGYRLGNCDITICAEQPKLNPHIPAMQQQLAACMDCDPGQVSIKATTTEKLGYTGRGEGIAAYAVALIETKPSQPC
jgi:2-C-methyl-D-erythritol 2,4-cyclodiphosphate synthase